MRHWTRRALAAFFVFLLFSMGSVPARAAAPEPGPFKARAVLVMDAASGKILFSKNAQEELPMASVTKLMTLYLAIRAVDQGRVRLNELVPVSEEAYRVNGSQIWLEPGERLTVNQMLKAIAIGSANDAAYALGEFLAGSEPAFVTMMNQTATRLGMRHTHFQNSHGLTEAGHYTSADDLAILARRAVEMPLLLKYTKMWQDRTIRNGKGGTLWLINHNRLLKDYPGTDGLKTGYTNAAGFCIVATAKRQDSRMIAVVLGAPSSKDRFSEAAQLMSWGFEHYQTVVLARKGQSFGTVTVARGSERRIEAVAPEQVAVTLERPVKNRPQARVELPAKIAAPVAKGHPVGRLVVEQGGQTLKTVPLVADRAVRVLGFPETAWRYFWRLIG